MKQHLMTQTNLSSESGRSMVEMLGVLAIVGVLSIGGIAGYRFAMAKYQANEILDNVMKRVVLASTAVQSPTNKYGQGSCCGFSMELPSRVGDFEYDAYCHDSDTLFVSVLNVPQNTCTILTQNIPNQAVRFGVDVTSSDDCMDCGGGMLSCPGTDCWDCGGGMECDAPLECGESNAIFFGFDAALNLPGNRF